MPDTPRDQPETVATEDAPRPPDNAIVTSDTPEEPPESREADAGAQAAAGEGDKPAGTNEPPSAGDDNKQQKPRNRSAERRIKKLSGKLSRATDLNQQQAQTIEAQNAEIARLKASQPRPVEPQLKDFDTPQEYAKAYSKYEKDAAEFTGSASPPPPASPPAPANEPLADDPLEDSRDEFLEAGKKQLGDEFAEALEEEGTAVSQAMAEFLFDDLEVGPAIYIHLSKNQKDAREIYDMPAHKQVKALEELADRAKAGQLDVEGQLQVAPPPGDTPPAKGGKAKTPGGTKAPEPPSSTKDAGMHNTDPNPESESMDEYAARRRKEEARRMGYIE